MSDPGLFVVGVLVTLLVTAALSLLIYAVFAKRAHLLTPWFHRMIALTRFNRAAREVLDDRAPTSRWAPGWSGTASRGGSSSG